MIRPTFIHHSNTSVIAVMVAVPWIAGSLSNANAAITSIALGDFANPVTIDFESSSTGAISGTDSIFTDAGISSVSAVSPSFGDVYDSWAGVGNALFASGAALAIRSPGDGVFFSSVPTFEFEFIDPIYQFGVSIADHGSMDFHFEFFSNATSVGHSNVNISGGDFSLYAFESIDPFDRVEITATPDGYGFDSIVVGVVPEPSTWVMMLIGVVILGAVSKRRLPLSRPVW